MRTLKRTLLNEWYKDHYRQYIVGNIYRLGFVNNSRLNSMDFKYINDSGDEYAEGVKLSEIDELSTLDELMFSYNSVFFKEYLNYNESGDVREMIRKSEGTKHFKHNSKVQLLESPIIITRNKRKFDNLIDLVVLRLFLFEEGIIINVIASKGYIGINEGGYANNLILL